MTKELTGNEIELILGDKFQDLIIDVGKLLIFVGYDKMKI